MNTASAKRCQSFQLKRRPNNSRAHNHQEQSIKKSKISGCLGLDRSCRWLSALTICTSDRCTCTHVGFLAQNTLPQKGRSWTRGGIHRSCGGVSVLHPTDSPSHSGRPSTDKSPSCSKREHANNRSMETRFLARSSGGRTVFGRGLLSTKGKQLIAKLIRSDTTECSYPRVPWI